MVPAPASRYLRAAQGASLRRHLGPRRRADASNCVYLSFAKHVLDAGENLATVSRLRDSGPRYRPTSELYARSILLRLYADRSTNRPAPRSSPPARLTTLADGARLAVRPSARQAMVEARAMARQNVQPRSNASRLACCVC